MLWSQGHRNETNFLVANRLQLSQEITNEVSGRRTPPVSLLTVSVPVQFQITNLVDWAYNNEDAPGLLEDLGTREVVRYLVGADMGEIMSYWPAGGRPGVARPHPGRRRTSMAWAPKSWPSAWAICIRP